VTGIEDVRIAFLQMMVAQQVVRTTRAVSIGLALGFGWRR
jgi:hypothetical protein